jgi:ribosome-binding protein aMBF1 (putative translation factor)
MKNKKTSDAVKLMNKWYGGDADWDQMLVEERLKVQVGQTVYDLRTEAGLSQEALAKLAGTSQSIVSRVENADYAGSALEMLYRICLALHRQVKVERLGQHVGIAC